MGSTNIREETLKVVANAGEVIVNRLRVNMVGHENGEKLSVLSVGSTGW